MVRGFDGRAALSLFEGREGRSVGCPFADLLTIVEDGCAERVEVLCGAVGFLCVVVLGFEALLKLAAEGFCSFPGRAGNFC